jgi:hypothetical protein
MTISNELLDELLKGCKRPEDLLGDSGLMKELKVRLMERMLGAELTAHMGYVDHHRLRNSRFCRHTFHHPGKDTLVAPPLPSVVERLRRAILPGRITPPQTIAIDEDNPAQHPSVIDAWLAMALGKEGFQTRHLRVRQPEKVAHCSVSLPSLNHADRASSMGPDPSFSRSP